MTLAEAELLAVSTLKEAMEAAINNKNIELAKVTSDGYHVSAMFRVWVKDSR